MKIVGFWLIHFPRHIWDIIMEYTDQMKKFYSSALRE